MQLIVRSDTNCCIECVLLKTDCPKMQMILVSGIEGYLEKNDAAYILCK